MLLALEIENLAVIEKLQMEPRPGLNVLTGETGAGKSILLDAIGLALGARAATDLVRTEADQARVDALFSLSEEGDLARVLEEQEVQLDEDGQLLLTREVSAQGRSTARVNGRLAPVGSLRELGQWLVDIHGQGQHQSLLQPHTQLRLLDAFAGSQVRELRDRVGDEHRRVRELAQRLENLEQEHRERARLQEVYRHQVEEIDAADISSDEEAELEREQRVLRNTEQLFMLVEGAYQGLYESENSSLDQVGQALGNVEQAARLDDRLEPLRQELESISAGLEEAGRRLADYREQLDLTPGRLEQVEERLHQLQELKRKYGATLGEVLEYREWAASELERLEQQEWDQEDLERELAQSREELAELASKLSERRREAASHLETMMAGELEELNMGEMELTVQFRAHSSGVELPGAQDAGAFCRSSGLEDVLLLLSANPGEEPRSLARVASGGELSRVMLALKTVLDRVDPVPTLIFDEIDAGVGGRAAQAVAQRLARLGRRRQVLCVTHLPQLASMADAHFRIDKEVEAGRTYTRVSELDEAGRVEELARMLGGARVTPAVESHAREMLRLAQETKEKLPLTSDDGE